MRKVLMKSLVAKISNYGNLPPHQKTEGCDRFSEFIEERTGIAARSSCSCHSVCALASCSCSDWSSCRQSWTCREIISAE